MSDQPVQPPAQTDTTEMDFIPPGTEPDGLAGYSPADQAVLQITRLATFLLENFPDEVGLTNRQQPEQPVDTAVRLLLSLSVKAPTSAVQRCSEPYCNRVEGHGGVHGVIHSG